jgi:tRNA threonylcarbamoyladenosine biosynthesis protein TsaB
VLILTLRTDKPEAEIGIYEDEKCLQYMKWEAHRKLADTIHLRIQDLLKLSGFEPNQLQGIGVYSGPGSFTGLRIGISVANAMSYGLAIPIVGAKGQAWIKTVTKALMSGKNDRLVLPIYGSLPHITQPKK